MPAYAPIDAEVLLRHSRWLARLARALVPRDDALLTPPAPATPDEALARAELRRRVVEAVLALAEPNRGAVILHFFEEQSVARIAHATKSPEETVQLQVRCGIGFLREALADSVRGEDERSAAARARLFTRLAQLAH
jgi:DNA-directed RNA polymerase specialized sigma24 family protein